jgi:predicted nucleic acid-binding protein
MASRPRVYWDANCLLSYLDGDEDRLPDLDELLRQARAERLELVTSALTQVEVAFGSREKEQSVLDPQVEAAIDELWTPASPIQLVEFYELIGREARTLMRWAVARGWSLKALDAVHLATAARVDAADFHTYDRQLHKYDERMEFPIREPVAAQPQLPGTG